MKNRIALLLNRKKKKMCFTLHVFFLTQGFLIFILLVFTALGEILTLKSPRYMRLWYMNTLTIASNWAEYPAWYRIYLVRDGEKMAPSNRVSSTTTGNVEEFYWKMPVTWFQILEQTKSIVSFACKVIGSRLFWPDVGGQVFCFAAFLIWVIQTFQWLFTSPTDAWWSVDVSHIHGFDVCFFLLLLLRINSAKTDVSKL